MEQRVSFSYLGVDQSMEANPRPKVKICCIQSIAEAHMALAAGADWIGLVSRMPSGPGVIRDHEIAMIAGSVKGRVTTVLLTSLQDAGALIGQFRSSGADALQLVDAVAARELRTLRDELPGVSVFQVIHVQGRESLGAARAVSGLVDAVLLDSGNPGLRRKELGGTGRVHDWNLSRTIREELDIPVLLAGGLTAANVRQAVDAVGPAGVDVCSGLRTNGALDREKLLAFMHAVRSPAHRPPS